MAYESAKITVEAYADTNGTVSVSGPLHAFPEVVIRDLAQKAVDKLQDPGMAKVGREIDRSPTPEYLRITFVYSF